MVVRLALLNQRCCVIDVFLVSKVGYVSPPMLMGNALQVISYGLFSTLKVTTGTGEWVGFQLLAGAGRGMAIQMVRLL